MSVIIVYACAIFDINFNSGDVEVLPTATFGEGDGQIVLDDVNCKGNEDDLSECDHAPLKIHNCGHIGSRGVQGPAQYPPNHPKSSPKGPTLVSNSSLVLLFDAHRLVVFLRV